MIATSRARALVPLAALAVTVLAGCAGQGGAPAPLPRGSVSDLADKLSIIVQDECQTKPAADIYRRCGRFTAELGNVAAAAQAAVAGRPGAAAAQGAAAKLSAALAAFTRDGCLGPNPAATCGADQTEIQRDVAALRTAVAAVPAGG